MSRSLIAALVLAALAPAGPVTTQTQSPIASALHRPPAAAARPGLEDALPAVSRFYEQHGFHAVWTGPAQLNSSGESVMRALTRADEDGLNPNDYVPSALAGLISQHTPQATTDLEVLLSLAVVRFARDLGWGITVPSEVDRDNSYDVRPFDAETVLGEVAAAGDPGEALRQYAPPSFVYGLVKRALAELRARRDTGGWTRATEGPTLRKGDKGPRVAELHAILTERGDLTPGPPSDVFDDTLVDGLKRFQDRNGLDADGVYGKKVVAEVNVPLSTRIKQVRLGLERLRWLPRTSTGRRIAVNLADFKTYVFDDDRVTFETRSVVGKLYHETPMFTGRMTFLVINPYWNVPVSIMRGELLPKAKADPEYLARNHFEYRRHVDAAAARPVELARAVQVHVPEPAQHLPARHAGAGALQRGGSRVLARVRAAREAGRAGGPAAERSGMDDGADSHGRRNRRRNGRHAGETDSCVHQLHHGVPRTGRADALPAGRLRTGPEAHRGAAAGERGGVGPMKPLSLTA